MKTFLLAFLFAVAGVVAPAAQLVKTANGLAIASVKTADQLAVASVKTFNGLDNTSGGGGLAIVQAAKGTFNSGSGGTVSISPTAGNLLVVCIVLDAVNTVHTMSDNIDGTTGWTKVTGVNVTLYGVSQGTSMWYKKNIPSGITTITWGSGGAAIYGGTGIAHEVSGASTSAPFTGGELVGTTYTASTTPTTTGVNSATAATVQFAMLVNDDTTSPALMTVNTAGSTGTWTLFNSTNSQELDDNNYSIMSLPSQIFSSTGNKVHIWTTRSFAGAYIQAAFH